MILFLVFQGVFELLAELTVAGTCLILSELLGLISEVAMAAAWTSALCRGEGVLPRSCLTANTIQETRKEESLVIHDKGYYEDGRVF